MFKMNLELWILLIQPVLYLLGRQTFPLQSSLPPIPDTLNAEEGPVEACALPPQLCGCPDLGSPSYPWSHQPWHGIPDIVAALSSRHLE